MRDAAYLTFDMELWGGDGHSVKLTNTSVPANSYVADDHPQHITEVTMCQLCCSLSIGQRGCAPESDCVARHGVCRNTGVQSRTMGILRMYSRVPSSYKAARCLRRAWSCR